MKKQKANQAKSHDAEIGEIQMRFVLPPAQWEAFNAMLDAPPKELPALKRLFS